LDEAKIFKNVYDCHMSVNEEMDLFKTFDEFVERWKHFVITSHVDPDADATGSEYGLYHALLKRNKSAVILNATEPDPKFTYFQTEDVFHTIHQMQFLPKDDFALIIVDTGDIDHIGHIADLILPKAKEVFIIDHHNVGSAKDLYPSIVVSERAATAEIIYELYRHWNLDISTDVAFGLFTGMVFDTGSFIYPKTSKRTFEIAQYLMDLGVKPKEVHSQLYERLTPERLKLLADVQSGMELISDNKIAIQSLTQETLKRTGATMADADNMINYPLKCTTVVVSVFFKELEDGTTKISLRSKGNFDVGQFAQVWGGGGHINAAGFAWKEGIDQTKIKVIKNLCEYIKQFEKT